MEQVKLYDTTLRDGMGGKGMSLSVGEKLNVVRALDRLGVQFIEAGFPSSNPKEAELFARLAELELENATVSAFGMTRRRDLRAEDDEALRTLVESFAPVVCLVGKSWVLHLEKVIRVSREENLAMIADSISFCREQGKRPVFDAEHFFDGYRDDPGYALECVRAAADAGAENVTLCDTNGGSLPDHVTAATAAVLADVGDRVEIGIHTHNDSECAVAAEGDRVGDHRPVLLRRDPDHLLHVQAPALADQADDGRERLERIDAEPYRGDPPALAPFEQGVNDLLD